MAELNNRRRGFNEKISWSPPSGGRHTIFVTANFNQEGHLCEIWVDNMKVGSDFRAIVKAFARITSKALQAGVPPQEIAKTLMDYEPTEFPYVLGAFIQGVATNEQ